MQARKSLKIYFLLWNFDFSSPSFRIRSILLKIEYEAGEDKDCDDHDEQDQAKLMPSLRKMIQIQNP